MSVERIIAVDFGTSTSAIRVKCYQNSQPLGDRLETKPVTFGIGSTIVPTLIQKRNTQETLYFGYDAEIPRRDTVTCRNFKVEIENPDSEVRDRARSLTTEFFSYLFKTYREQSLSGHLGENVDQERTIISYPVKWSEEAKAFMRETARKVGFPHVEGQDEAQAAIQSIIVQNEKLLQNKGYFIPGIPTTILVIDMGAGTTDLVLCRYIPGKSAETKEPVTWPKGGNILFGGNEVDELLRGYIKSLIPENKAKKILEKITVNDFKSWKEHILSPGLAQEETVYDFSVLDNWLDVMDVDMDYSINRQTFEDFAQDYLQGLPELVTGCLQEARVNGEDVDLVILTGGHSQWYFVRDILSGKLDRFGDLGLTKIQADPGRIISVTLPQETVALGMTYTPLNPFPMTEFNRIQTAVLRDDADAQFRLGLCYYIYDHNYEQAIQCYRKAAELGNFNAQYNLGLCYEKGWGVQKNLEQACNYYKIAADNGLKNDPHTLHPLTRSALTKYKEMTNDKEMANDGEMANDFINSIGVQKVVAESQKIFPKVIDSLSKLIHF